MRCDFRAVSVEAIGEQRQTVQQELENPIAEEEPLPSPGLITRRGLLILGLTTLVCAAVPEGAAAGWGALGVLNALGYGIPASLLVMCALDRLVTRDRG